MEEKLWVKVAAESYASTQGPENHRPLISGACKSIEAKRPLEKPQPCCALYDGFSENLRKFWGYTGIADHSQMFCASSLMLEGTWIVTNVVTIALFNLGDKDPLVTTTGPSTRVPKFDSRET